MVEAVRPASGVSVNSNGVEPTEADVEEAIGQFVTEFLRSQLTNFSQEP